MSSANTAFQDTLKRSLPMQLVLPEKGELPEKLEHYVKIISNPYIKLLCEPLRQIQINYFQYVKRLPDSSYIYLTNNGEWQSHYFSNRYYLINEFESPHKQYDTGFFLWLGMKNQAIFQHMDQFFDIRNGITFIQHYKDCTEFFHFGSESKDLGILNFYFEYMNILKRFMLYFKDKSWDLIKGLAQCKIFLPKRKNDEANHINNARKVDCFNKLIEIDRYFISDEHSDIYLTKREMECLKWYCEGKTAEEIGIILGISKRTVEYYLLESKNKINRLKKQFLINLIL